MIKKHIVTSLIIATTALFIGCGATETKDIGKDKAQEIAFADANVTESDISLLHISRETDDGKIVYEIQFTDALSGASYDYEILASDGTIQKFDKKNEIPEATTMQQEQTNQPEQSESQSNKPTTDSQNQNNAQTQTRNRNNGQNTEKKQDNAQAQVSISLEKAKKLALDRVSGATENNIHIKLDYDDGHYVYEGEILYEQKEYEFEIDANTGTFLEWSEERR